MSEFEENIISLGTIDESGSNCRQERRDAAANRARILQTAENLFAQHGVANVNMADIAQAAEVGICVEEEKLPVFDECALLCRHFGLDPLGLIGSGSLLIAAGAEQAPAIVERLESAGVRAGIIGTVVPADEGCSLRADEGTSRPLPTFARDEIIRLFEPLS